MSSDYQEFLKIALRGVDTEGESLLLKRKLSALSARACRVSNDGPLFLFPIGYQEPVPVRFKVLNIETKKQFFSEKSALHDGDDYTMPFFNQQDFRDKSYVIITEGEWDCMSWIELGYQNVVSLPNGINSAKSACKNWFKWLNTFEAIYMSFDNDDVSRPVTEEMKGLLPLMKWRVIHTPHKDINDCLKAGLSQEGADSLFSNAERYHPAGVVKASEVSLESILKASPKGMATHYPLFDHILGGLRPGEVTCVIGDTGTGKTSFGLQLMHNVLMDRIPCYTSSQEMSKERLLKKMASTVIRKRILNDGSALSEGETNLLKKWLRDVPLYVDPDGATATLESVVENIEFVSMAEGVKLFLIEDIGSLTTSIKGGEEREKYEAIIKKMHSLALSLNVHILLVCHVKQLGDDRGDVGMSDIKGSSGIKQYADNVIAVRRMDRGNDDEKMKGLVKVSVIKNRERGDEGFVLFRYEAEKSYYTECMKK